MWPMYVQKQKKRKTPVKTISKRNFLWEIGSRTCQVIEKENN